VCLKASPGVNGSPALEITFSQRSSTACRIALNEFGLN
jgi:hypothetical protein